MTFDVDTSINSTILTDEYDIFKNITGERRVSNVKINGENLDLNRIYNVSLLEFHANGGDGYFIFDEFDLCNESLITDIDAFCYFIENNLKGEVPEKYKGLQGRIKIDNEI